MRKAMLAAICAAALLGTTVTVNADPLGGAIVGGAVGAGTHRLEGPPPCGPILNHGGDGGPPSNAGGIKGGKSGVENGTRVVSSQIDSNEIGLA